MTYPTFLLYLFLIGVNGEFHSVSEYLVKNKESILNRETTEACDLRKNAYINGILAGENWALQMLDATGKIPSGIMKGNAIDYGYYDECLEINEYVHDLRIRGNYCVFGLVIPYEEILNMLPNITALSVSGATESQQREDLTASIEGLLLLSVCLPDQCAPSDVFGDLGVDNGCVTKEEISVLTTADFACIAFLSAVVGIMVMSTLYDFHLQQHKLSTHPIYVAFSVYTNGKKLLKTTTSDDPNQIMCFHGLKTISLFWIITGHSIVWKQFQIFVMNVDDAKIWERKWYSVYILQAYLAVDTFLFLSGILLAYNFLKSMSKPNARFNIFLYYLHRYIRLTPAFAAMFFVYITIATKISSGPYWTNGWEMFTQPCYDYWWSIFLYVQNYVAGQVECLPHTWYLSVDMQLFILSPFILLPLLRYQKKMLLIGMPVLIFVSILTPFLVLFFYEITYESEEFNTKYYFLTHNRLSPWLIGLTFSAVLLKIGNRKIKINKYVNASIWLLDLVLMGIIFFTEDDVAFNYNKWKMSAYFSIYRAAWAVCLCWVVFACVNDPKGIMNQFFSIPVFQIFSKLSYSIYMVHFTIILINLFHKRVLATFSDFENIHEALGSAVMSVFLGTFWTLAFESPMITIERIIFGQGAVKSSAKQAAHVENSLNDAKNTGRV